MDGYETLLPYYQRELSFLRREGADFAQQYPQIARRLDVAGDTVTDPDVERLIESVAFLTARIQHVIDQEFPIIPTAMLDILSIRNSRRRSRPWPSPSSARRRRQAS